MADRHRAARLASCAMAVVLVASPVSSATAHATAEIVRSVTEPDTTEPDTTEPGAATSGDDDDDTAVAVIAVIAFAALIGLAGWWMVRRNDADDAQHPRPPTPDEPLPGQDLI